MCLSRLIFSSYVMFYQWNNVSWVTEKWKELRKSIIRGCVACWVFPCLSFLCFLFQFVFTLIMCFSLFKLSKPVTFYFLILENIWENISPYFPHKGIIISFFQQHWQTWRVITINFAVTSRVRECFLTTYRVSTKLLQKCYRKFFDFRFFSLRIRLNTWKFLKQKMKRKSKFDSKFSKTI